jgi:hypothetical protein
MALYPSSYTVEHFHNDDGTLLSGGTLEFYIAGTSTPTPFYIDSAATQGGTSVTLNDRGEPEVSSNPVIIWLSSDVNYKIIAKNASGGTEWTQDNLIAADFSDSGTQIAAADFSQWPSVEVNASDTAHDMDFLAGKIADSSGASLLTLSSTMVKQLDSAWAAGNNSGGLFSGSIASSTTYYCFLIEANADQSIDCGFDTSSTAANIPSGYTKYRRIASFETDGSANIDANSFIYLLHAEIAKRGENNGTCPLNESGLVPLSNLSQNIDTMKTDLDAAEAAIISNDGDITALQTGKEDVKAWVSKWTGSANNVTNSWGIGKYALKAVGGTIHTIELLTTSDAHAGSSQPTTGYSLSAVFEIISPGNYRFRLAYQNISTGAVTYVDITQVWKFE